MDPKVTPATPAAGLILHDRYRVVRPIGRGGMGTVYEAIDLRLRNVVAVKQMTAAGFEADQAFEREAALLASLRHASLPVVIDYFIDEMGRFFVMQYIDGEDLSDLLSRQQAPCLLEEVRSWALTLLETLDYLHSHVPPIVHRDIKPSNLRLTARGELILLDFGLAKGRAVPHVSWTAFEKSIFGFTPRYSPPEQLLGGVTTPQSDLYALGATLYYLATGTAPAHAGDRTHARSAGLPDPLVSAHHVNADLPVGFSNILSRALAVDPAERFASALEMRLALLEDGSVTRPFSRVAPVSSRRVDAALPSRAEVGRHIDLVVQVRFADSPRLGLEDWPTRRRPAAIEQESAAVRVVYPVDRQSGAFLPARLRLRIVAPDFAIDGETERLIEAPPDDYSTRIVFLVSAIKEGYCRLNVEVYGPDAVYLGAIPLEAEAFTVSDAASQLRVGHMVLILTSASLIDGMTRVTQEGFGPAPTVRQAKAPSRARREVSSRKSSGLRQLGATAVVVLVAGALWISLFPRKTQTPDSAGSQATTQASPPVTSQPASSPVRTATLTIAKPTGGTIVGPGIQCGTMGSDCATEVPAGTPVALMALPDSNQVLRQFTGDCPATGEMTMSAGRNCSAIFVRATQTVAENGTAAGPAPVPPTGRADPLEARRPAAGGPTGSAPPPTLAESSPVLSPDVVARKEILRLVETYCAAYEKLNLQSMRTVLRTADLSPIPKLLLDDPNLRCTSTPPEFERLDASASGSARLHFTMTHAAASSRSQPGTTVRYVVMEVSRRDSANPWLIDRILVADPSPR